MQITNNLNLPQPLYDAIEAAYLSYDPGESDITCSQLPSPPQMVELQRRHREDIVVDVSKLIYAFLGTVMHHALEVFGQGGVRIVERRFYQDVLGWKVGGQVDLIENGVLDDYKLMSVWEAIFGLKKEKVIQLNILRWLAERNGVPVTKIRIVGLFRDWTKSKSYESDYPSEQGMAEEVEMWSLSDTLDYVHDRVHLHQNARAGHWDDCTEEERWAKPSKWAVMKKGQKRAMKLHDTEQKAVDYLTANVGKGVLSIVHRPGENTRCEHWCDVKDFCIQYREMNNDEP